MRQVAKHAFTPRLSYFTPVIALAFVLAATAPASADGVLSAVSVSAPAGAYEIATTEQGDELSVAGYGRLLVPGKPNLPAKIFANRGSAGAPRSSP